MPKVHLTAHFPPRNAPSERPAAPSGALRPGGAPLATTGRGAFARLMLVGVVEDDALALLPMASGAAPEHRWAPRRSEPPHRILGFEDGPGKVAAEGRATGRDAHAQVAGQAEVRGPRNHVASAVQRKAQAHNGSADAFPAGAERRATLDIRSYSYHSRRVSPKAFRRCDPACLRPWGAMKEAPKSGLARGIMPRSPLKDGHGHTALIHEAVLQHASTRAPQCGSSWLAIDGEVLDDSHPDSPPAPPKARRR